MHQVMWIRDQNQLIFGMEARMTRWRVPVTDPTIIPYLIGLPEDTALTFLSKTTETICVAAWQVVLNCPIDLRRLRPYMPYNLEDPVVEE